MARSTNPVRYRVEFSVRDLPGVLDMLRYDAANVIGWDRLTPGPGGDRYALSLSADRYPTVGRWVSFGIYPKDLITGGR